MAGVHLCVCVQCGPHTVVSKISYFPLHYIYTFNKVYSNTCTSDQVSFYNMKLVECWPCMPWMASASSM